MPPGGKGKRGLDSGRIVRSFVRSAGVRLCDVGKRSSGSSACSSKRDTPGLKGRIGAGAFEGRRLN